MHRAMRHWLARGAVCLLASFLLLLQDCGIKSERRFLVTPDQYQTLDKKSPYLKVHLKNGDLLILTDWNAAAAESHVLGFGHRYNPNREPIDSGSFNLSIDSVALFETNVARTSPVVGALSIMVGVTVALTIVCIASPKTCFGSCPTFYVSDGTYDLLQAEGFSSCVAPSLERRDIDALYRARPSSRELRVTMKNEALETHVIRYADILAATRPPGGRVVATSDGMFYEAHALMAPSVAMADEGDCLRLVSEFDGVERFSLADSTNLAVRETIELEFDSLPSGPKGLVLASRQSLLTTFLFYQTLSYLGSQAGYWMAEFERHPEWKSALSSGVGEQLGWIEVQLPDSLGNWQSAGYTRETGPLATDVRMVVLPPLNADTARIRLRLTKGHWRIDYVALALLGEEVLPVRLHPITVLREGMTDEEATASLNDTLAALVTMPGDEYTLVYELPEVYENQELFLAAKGYYLEWMRQEWLAEENPDKAMMIFVDPQRAMRELAPEFKKVEREIEARFWGSRYAQP